MPISLSADTQEALRVKAQLVAQQANSVDLPKPAVSAQERKAVKNFYSNFTPRVSGSPTPLSAEDVQKSPAEVQARAARLQGSAVFRLNAGGYDTFAVTGTATKPPARPSDRFHDGEFVLYIFSGRGASIASGQYPDEGDGGPQL